MEPLPTICIVSLETLEDIIKVGDAKALEKALISLTSDKFSKLANLIRDVAQQEDKPNLLSVLLQHIDFTTLPIEEQVSFIAWAPSPVAEEANKTLVSSLSKAENRKKVVAYLDSLYGPGKIRGNIQVVILQQIYRLTTGEEETKATQEPNGELVRKLLGPLRGFLSLDEIKQRVDIVFFVLVAGYTPESMFEKYGKDYLLSAMKGMHAAAFAYASPEASLALLNEASQEQVQSIKKAQDWAVSKESISRLSQVVQQTSKTDLILDKLPASARLLV